MTTQSHWVAFEDACYNTHLASFPTAEKAADFIDLLRDEEPMIKIIMGVHTRTKAPVHGGRKRNVKKKSRGPRK